ncbi:MAG: SET domain-containing protein [Myxococcota bacterium]
MARIPGLQVIRSSVEGYGVIATRKFKKGSVICNVDGVLWREGERRDDRYSLILEPGIFFDMVDQTRWINHSCEPNVVVEAGVTRRGNGWAQLQALRDIAPGDELFFDYALPPELKEPCRCGAKRCRGWIVDPAHAEPAPKRRAKGR